MFCPNCGQKIADDSNFCRFCGSKIDNFDEDELNPPTSKTLDMRDLKEVKRKSRKLNWVFLTIVGVIGILAVIFSTRLVKSVQNEVEQYNFEYRDEQSNKTPYPRSSSFSSSNTNNSQTETNIYSAVISKSDAFSVAQEMVLQQLKAPSSAKFCKITEALFSYNLQTQYWSVEGWVDAQNSFGAMLRHNFTVTFQEVKKGEQVGGQHGKVVFD